MATSPRTTTTAQWSRTLLLLIAVLGLVSLAPGDARAQERISRPRSSMTSAPLSLRIPTGVISKSRTPTRPSTTTTTAPPTTVPPTTVPPTTTTTTVPAAPAPAPGPLAGRVVFDSDRTGNFELFTMAPDGTGARRLTTGPAYDSWWPKPSPDGTTIVFYRTPKGVHDLDYTQASLWSIRSDGTELRELLPRGSYGWTHQGHVEWSPDGSRLVMFGGAAPSLHLFVTAPDGTAPQQVTNRPGVSLDPSWSVDGRTLFFVGCPQAHCVPTSYEIYRIGVDGSGERRLTSDSTPDYDPYQSPDGSSVAWLRNSGGPRVWGIHLMAPDGTGARALIDDGGINSKPSWSADSKTVYFHRAPVGSLFSVWRIGADGRDLVQLPGRNPTLWVDEYPVAPRD